jgi:hypothetical protein
MPLIPEKLTATKCKSCSKLAAHGEKRCEAHEVEFQHWLNGRRGNSLSEYRPRFNGVIGLYEGEQRRDQNQRGRVRLTQGLRAGQELNFERPGR